jgi:hypothetical protein
MTHLRTALALTGMLALVASAAQAAPAFNDLDKDHDGMLTRAEASGVKGLDFAKADTNKDGRLDRAEYAAAIA